MVSCGWVFWSCFVEAFHTVFWDLHADVMWSTNMAAGNQRKHMEFTLRWKRLLFAHEIKYMCMNTSPNILERLKLLRFKGIDLSFFPNQILCIMVLRKVTIGKFKMLYFQNEICHGTGNLKTDLFLVHHQPPLDINSEDLVILIF